MNEDGEPDPAATRVLTLGETLGVAVTGVGDPLRTAASARLHTAGAESTVAIGLRRLGIASCWVGAVGADEVGARVLRDLSAEGVDTRFVRTDPSRATGFMLRELCTAEITRVTYYRAGSAGSQVCPADVEAALDGFEPTLVHLTGITPALSGTALAAVQAAAHWAEDMGLTLSFDVNYRSTLPGSAAALDVVRRLAGMSDVLFVGDDELHLLVEETEPAPAAAALHALGPTEVVVKQGAAGALASLGGRSERVDALPVQVADVVGAGDSFVAGYLAARAHGHPVAERLRWATVCAARTVATHGDWEGLPTRAEIDLAGGVFR